MESWNRALADLAGDGLVSLKRQAFLLCGDDHQAEDLVQDALVRAFGRSLRAPRPESVEAYVRKIMMNLFIDRARRQSRWNRAAPLLAADQEDIPDPADEIVARDVIRAALDGLSPRQRACVVMRYYLDLPVTQVAADLGVAEGTVKRYLSEAMPRIAARLAPVQDR
jgi:RNA polymerase sigma-70 factor (sigma-E family)